jgi:hypothetical protein
MFRVEPLIITTFDFNHDFSADDFSLVVDKKRIVADAEKAFVSLLKPQYNVVKFANYPKSTDGLYGSDYIRYTYFIDEDIAFETRHSRIRGRRVFADPAVANQADFISVDGETVKLWVSGVDFPADYRP